MADLLPNQFTIFEFSNKQEWRIICYLKTVLSMFDITLNLIEYVVLDFQVLEDVWVAQFLSIV